MAQMEVIMPIKVRTSSTPAIRDDSCIYYSSITYSNVSIETLKNITSKAAIKPSQGGSFAVGTINEPVARTAPITTGKINGNTRIGNNTSRACVAAAIAEKSVPIVATPSVPSNTMGTSTP